MYNKSRNRLQPKRAENLVYVYTNSRLMAEGKDKDEKKWYVDNVDSEDSDSAPEEEFEDHGDLDSDGMDDGNLGVRGSYGGTNRSPYSPWQDYALDPKDEYTFRDEEDEHLRGTPSIATFVNGDGLLNNDNILQKSSIVEDVENVLAVKASNVDEIGTKKEMLPAHSLSWKGHTSGGGKDGEVAKKTTMDVSLTVCNAYVKEESDIEKLDPISSTGAMLGEGNSSGRGQGSSMSDCPSRALSGSSSKNVEPMKLGSSQGLVSLSKTVHPRVKNGDGCTSESDRDIPIGTVFKRNPTCPLPHEDGLSHGKQLQALTKIKREPIGRPKSGRTGPVAVSQQKWKSLMQSFARSPLNTKRRPKTPLDGRHKRAKYGSIQERVGGICTRDDSSDDEREESDSPDGSSRAEVKGDDDYSLGD
jgi:hypothetical protein